MKDKVFTNSGSGRYNFEFDETVADVFDDMLERSVPLYHEMERMVVELATRFQQKDTNVYDLGCSLGTTMEQMMLGSDVEGLTFIGCDLSEPMLEKARSRLSKIDTVHAWELRQTDLNDMEPIENASVVVMVLTLQFLRPLHREALIRNIYQGLRENGALIVIEKILGNDSLFNRLFIDLYYAFKERNGYSKTEIAEKREALENVLIPYRMDENMELLEACGFARKDVFLKWYNFSGFMAIK